MMKFLTHTLVALVAATAGGSGVYYFVPPTIVQEMPVESPEQWEVRHSPRGGCTAHIVEEIDKAKQQIYVWSYSFTSLPIADALIRAHQRGVKVGVVIDGNSVHANGGKAMHMVHNDVLVYADRAHAIQHQKVMAIDGTLIFGSFNWTVSAETRNSEVLITLRNCKIEMYAKFVSNWRLHQEHGELLRKPK